jgi:hypothetical protein
MLVLWGICSCTSYKEVSKSVYSRSELKKRTFDYYYTAPFLENEHPEVYKWIILKSVWIQDPAKLKLFLSEWTQKKLVVGPLEEPGYQNSVLAGIQRYQLPNQEISIYQPLITFEEDRDMNLERIFWMNGLALGIFFLVSYVRFQFER